MSVLQWRCNWTMDKNRHSFMSMRKFHPSQRKEMARITHAAWMLCVLQLCWKNSRFGLFWIVWSDWSDFIGCWKFPLPFWHLPDTGAYLDTWTQGWDRKSHHGVMCYLVGRNVILWDIREKGVPLSAWQLLWVQWDGGLQFCLHGCAAAGIRSITTPGCSWLALLPPLPQEW